MTVTSPAATGTGGLPERSESILSTVRRGLALSPELRTGLAGTIALALVWTVGRVAVPVAIQQGIDRGLQAPGGPNLGLVGTVVVMAVALLAVTTVCGYAMMVRLFTVSETALTGVRVRAFRHIHDLSMLHQQAERRGALVSRVTTDVDSITQFMQFGGVMLLISFGQLSVAAVVMTIYSWQLTLVVFAAFIPAAFLIRILQQRLADAYGVVRRRVGEMLAAIGESVVGAQVIRAYGVAGRTARRLDHAISGYQQAQQRAQRMSVASFSVGELAAGLALSGVVLVGVMLGVDGSLTVGQLTAFLFLVNLFIQPVQMFTELLNEGQNAVAGWRRVLSILDVKPDVADPAVTDPDGGQRLPSGPLSVRFVDVGFAYPGSATEALGDVNLTIEPGQRVAVVGETGSGKTTFAKLLTRLMDPTRGRIELGGVPLTRVRFDALRSRVVMVPQDGFLFHASVADNVRFGRPTATDAELELAFTELGLSDWVASLPEGMHTQVGERGEALSVGERQLVALARAYLADPDLLVLDEATSAVDPATEVRLQRALDAVTRGRTTVTIAHRLSTAQAADEVIVVDKGRVVQRGPHAELVRDPDSVYAWLYASWLEQTRSTA
ncbi:MAG TPA: ABC transporter ATP-binding protein [Natronosporangium sp.]|nr:ABC transporter ATP-binding protein [Natronosporangium sp.]